MWWCRGDKEATLQRSEAETMGEMGSRNPWPKKSSKSVARNLWNSRGCSPCIWQCCCPSFIVHTWPPSFPKSVSICTDSFKWWWRVPLLHIPSFQPTTTTPTFQFSILYHFFFLLISLILLLQSATTIWSTRTWSLKPLAWYYYSVWFPTYRNIKVFQVLINL